MNKVFFVLLIVAALFDLNAAPKKNVDTTGKQVIKPAYKKKIPAGAPVEMKETWGWVMQNRIGEFHNDYPLTDVGLFAADVDCYGVLTGVPSRNMLSGFQGRVHLVIVCDSKSLTHFVLDPKFGLTNKLVSDIMKAVEPFDGLNVDYELIPGKDGANFMRFLEQLSTECKKKGKMFTVCVPARVKTISDDIFPYKKIAAISDRVMVMAYDEHWATSKPGSVASTAWCQKIVDYSVTVVPQEKLVMGIPFYGRSWASEKVNQAWYWEGANRIIDEYDAGKVTYENNVPVVDINIKVKTKLWFEDANSTVSKMRMYKAANVDKVAFWRIGQEDPSVWNWIKLENPAEIDN